MADLCLVPQVYNARRWEVDVTSFSRISRIVAELEVIPAIAAAHPDKVKP
jgi:maleylacetoacetate isomerase